MVDRPAYCRPEAIEALRRELPGAHTPMGLARAACAIAQHADDSANADRVEDQLRRLGDAVRGRLKSSQHDAALAHLHDVLFDLIGFRGAEQEDYYNPLNSYLPAVLDRRRGIPISLVLVYRAVADCVGVRVEGVNSPGHFLAAVHRPEAVGVDYVDPFYSGALLTPEEAAARVEAVIGQPLPPEVNPLPQATPAAWLRRMLMNLQAIFARSQQERDLLAMQELETLLPAE
ncbi:MAG: transglutaminase-like domain-containing protein [Planctomycetota bacterium]